MNGVYLIMNKTLILKYIIKKVTCIAVIFFISDVACSEQNCNNFSSVDLGHYQQIQRQLNLPKTTEVDRASSVTVAVIDTGLDVLHPAFSNKLWMNPGEMGLDSRGKQKSDNRIDDDGNGFIDDLHGWNFTENQNRFPDKIGHGTHISGLIAAEDSCSNFRGLAPNSKIMVLKYYEAGQSGKETLDKSIMAMEYAIKMGAQIINYSGGGNLPSDKELEALKRAEEKGIIVIAAAGNEKQQADKAPYYPASYKLKNILSVAAASTDFDLAKFSNYGLENVHIAAPGVDIISTLPGSRYGRLSGTSQATAFVTGVVAILLGREPDLSPQQIIRRLQASRRYLASLEAKTQFQGLVDVGSAVRVRDDQGSLYGGQVAHTGIMKNWFLLNNKKSILFLE